MTALSISRSRWDGRSRPPVSRRFEVLSLFTCQPCIGVNPKGARIVFGKSANHVSRQTARGGKRSDGPIFPTGQPLAGTDPHRTVAALKQAAHIVAGKCGVGGVVEERKTVSVEADQSNFGPKPHEPIAGLDQCLDGVLGQAVFHDPRLSAIAGKWSRRLQCHTCDRKAQGHSREPKNEARRSLEAESLGRQNRALQPLCRICLLSDQVFGWVLPPRKTTTPENCTLPQ